MVLQVLSATFNRFFQSEKSAGRLLVFCTLGALLIANSPWGAAYLVFWQTPLLGLSVEHWVNDGLMAIFFLMIGLELEREIYVGELSVLRNALLPFLAAIGGMIAPAAIHSLFNYGTPTQAGFGIPMATDIAFALSVLSLLGRRIPAALKVFVVAFAVIDDLGAIIVIALVYSKNLSLFYLLSAILLWGVLIVMNRLQVMRLMPYLVGGALLWFLMLKSGIHATLAGVLLAFAIPFRAPRQKAFYKAQPQGVSSADHEDRHSPSHRLENTLHKPVAFVILPIFALANTAIPVDASVFERLVSNNAIGIMLGLIIGKPMGVVLMCFLGIRMGICTMPLGLDFKYILGAGILGGIGFTMSIFITNLAFEGMVETIIISKMSILLASLFAGALGFLVLMGRKPGY